MSRFSAKIEIINHFDQLINRVDIDIDECLKNYTEEQDLSQIERYQTEERYFWDNDNYFLNLKDAFDSSKHSGNQTNDLWSESTKVVDYLKQVRMRTIEELKKAQEDTLEYYKLNCLQFKSDENIDELKSQLFADKFYFQVYFTQSKKRYWLFNLFTFVTDFYMSPSDINILEKSINEKQSEISPFSQVSNIVFDEKMILIGVLFEYFIKNILIDEDGKFPNHVIHVRKQDVLNINEIDFNYELDKINLTGSSLSIDMSKIEVLNLNNGGKSIEVNIEGKLLPSLKTLNLKTKSIKEISLRNLRSVEMFSFHLTDDTLDENLARNVLDQLPNTQELSLQADFSYFNLDNLVNLKNLEIFGDLNDEFNYDLFENLCEQLEKLSIRLYAIDNNDNIFYDKRFPYLKSLSLSECEINVLKKNFSKRFPMLERLKLNSSKISYIDHDAFSNMKQLVELDLSINCIERLDKRHFLELVNLKELNLNKNRIRIIGKNLFSNLKKLEYLTLSFNIISSPGNSFLLHM